MEDALQNQPVLEKRARRNGIEIPIQCILRTTMPKRDRKNGWRPHYHEYIEFLFGLDACDVNAWIAGEHVQFCTGDLLVINAGVAHDFDHSLEQSRYLCIKVLPEVLSFFENPIIERKYVFPFFEQNLLPYRLYTAKETEGSPLPSVFSDLQRCWNEQEFGYEIELKSLFLQIFLWIIRTGRKNGLIPMEATSELSDESIFLIQRSIEFLRKSYADVTEAKAAAEANVSYSYYSKLFRRVVGRNFNDYLTALRISEAERMLLSGSASITEIALATGFSSSSHFIDKFKKHRGKTPKQYRMQAQQ